MGGSGSPVPTKTVSSSDNHDDERANRARQMMKRVKDAGNATVGKVSPHHPKPPPSTNTPRRWIPIFYPLDPSICNEKNRKPRA
jgi:hypothetical protein